MFNSFDFIGKRKLWFGFSGLLIILSVVSIILFRFNWGIDFTGGTILELAFPKNVTVEEVRDGLRADGLETATIQLSGSNMQGESGDDAIIRTRNLSAEEAKEFVEHVDDCRVAYHKYYTDLTWGNADDYDICLDCDRLGAEQTAAMIEHYVKEVGSKTE